jgi:hypothetical protein
MKAKLNFHVVMNATFPTDKNPPFELLSADLKKGDTAIALVIPEGKEEEVKAVGCFIEDLEETDASVYIHNYNKDAEIPWDFILAKLARFVNTALTASRSES